MTIELSPSLAFTGAAGLARLVAQGVVSSEELLHTVAERLESVNPQVNAVVTLDLPGAADRARRLDREYVRGGPVGTLHGLPFTVKDSIETAGIRTTSGTVRYAHHVPERNAPAVDRLVGAGGVILGKSNVPKLAGDFQTYNGLFGVTANPWDLERTAGGSSGGSAAAVACGLSVFDLGSDSAGSLTIPAHYCGVCGFKPTHGAVPYAGHVPPPPGSRTTSDLAVMGPIARRVEDLELLYGVLSGTEPPRQPGRGQAPRLVPWLTASPCPTESAVLQVLEDAVAAVERRGGRLVQAGPPVDLEEASAVGLQLLGAAAALSASDDRFAAYVEVAESIPAGAEAEAWALMARGLTLRHRDWLFVKETCHAYRTLWERFFEDVDAVLCPVSPVAAFRHDVVTPREQRSLVVDGVTRPYFDQIFWPSIVAMAGLPAAVVPAGLTDAGLPVGIQIVGAHGSDWKVLELARLVENSTGGFRATPI